MKKTIRIVCILLLTTMFSLELIAENNTTSSSGGGFEKVGAAGSQFLKIGIGARATGMAGAYGAVANDLTALFWNPAGIADLKAMAGNFSYTKWFADFNHSFASVSMPIGEQFTAAASFVSFGCDKIDRTTLENPEGTGTYYSVSDFSLGLSIGGYLTDQFSFGITGKYLSNSFADLNATGFAFDIGTMYQTGIQGIKLGFSIHNLGTEMQYRGVDLNTTKKLIDALNISPLDAQYLTNSYSIPLTFRAGVTSDVYTSEEHNVMAAADFVTLSDTPEQFAFGAEYSFKKLISFRAGYRLGQDQTGFAAGIGISYLGGGFGGNVDYSITPTKDLGLINRISLNLDLK